MSDIPENQREEFLRLLDSGKYIELEERLLSALANRPNSEFEWMMLGMSLHLQGKDGIPALTKAESIAPNDPSIQINLASILTDLDQLYEAEACYRRVLLGDPDNVFARYNLANLLHRIGRHSEAEIEMRSVLFEYPKHADANNNFGSILWCSGRALEAEAYFRRALAEAPAHPDALCNLCNLLRELGRLAEAELVARRAIELDPASSDFASCLGTVLKEIGRLEESEHAFRQALEVRFEEADIHTNLGSVLMELGRLGEARLSFENAVRIAPSSSDALNNLGVLLKDLGNLEDAELMYRRALETDPSSYFIHSNLLFAYNYSPRHSQEFCYREAVTYGRRAREAATEPFGSWLCPIPAERLRIGFVSGDLRSHPVGFFLEGLLKHLDSNQFELVAYSTHHRTDALTERIRPYFSSWHSLLGLSDKSAASLIHQHGIHMLVDLSGHSAFNRLPVFSWKPAPVALSWLGYFATTGVTEIDYLVVDSNGPREDCQKYFVEKLWYLPETRLCFTPPDVSPQVAPSPSIRNGHVTFGCFQNLTKIGDDVLQLWSHLINTVPTARIRWQCKQLSDPLVGEQFLSRLKHHNFDLDRVMLYGRTSYTEYLASYSEVDVILDTFPFPGGTTSCEALWMGVPTLTLAGETLLTGQGASILRAAGLCEFVASDAADYLAKAIRIASDTQALAELRSNLRARVMASPLFDQRRFARNFEKALWGMWNERGMRKDTRSSHSLVPGCTNPSDVQAAEFHLSEGVTHLKYGRLGEAEACFRRAIETDPGSAEAHFKLGNALSASNQLGPAERSFREAVSLDPHHVKALYNLGNTLRDLGHADEAEHCYRRVVEIDPAYVSAFTNLGVLLYNQGNLTEAERAYRQALSIVPNDLMTLNNLSLSLMARGELVEAEKVLRRVIMLRPDYPEALNNLGVVLNRQCRFFEAAELFRAAIGTRNHYPEALNNLGVALKELGLWDEAESAYRRAITLKSDYVDALNNFGVLLQEKGFLSDALTCFQSALGVDPECAETYNNLGILHSFQCLTAEAISSFRRALQIRPDYCEAHSNLLLVMNYDESFLPHLADEARDYGHRVLRRTSDVFASWQCQPNPRRLRIGIVSGDLRDHPVGYFVESVLAHIDSTKLEFVAYPTSVQESDLTERIRPLFAEWHPIAGNSDCDAATLIYKDGIHLLLDLAGHTAHNRLPVFAYKPAPIQASWLGYCATTGVAAIDYLIADRLTIPEWCSDKFTEVIWHLPKSYLCFSRPDVDIEAAPLPALQNGKVTFGSFNNIAKIGDSVVKLWARVLEAVPESELVLKARQFDDKLLAESIYSRFAEYGIARERLILLGSVASRREHLLSYRLVDIALDPFPYNGVTTTLEALWMGVPVLTLSGNSFLSRQGVGLLSNAGLQDWIAVDSDDYLAKAEEKARDLNSLAKLRAGLRAQLLSTPLFDANNFARDFQEALWKMWHVREKSLPS